MNSLAQNEIEKFISSNAIKERIIISNSFGMLCEKICLENNQVFIAKYYEFNNIGFNSIKSEANSLTFLQKALPKLFPKIKFKSDNLIIIDFIKHNNIKKTDYQITLAKELLKLHSISNNKYGFNFDTQTGGLKQPNELGSNWVKFFLEKRLNMIYEKINQKKPLPKLTNKKIELLMKNISDYLPNNPKISLLHGDLWEGNILFNNGKLVGLIDPGIYYGHNELEISYLKWFKFIDNKFLNFYSNTLKIDNHYEKYEPVYQLYFSLLNVYLWDRDFYLKDTNKLLSKISKHKD